MVSLSSSWRNKTVQHKKAFRMTRQQEETLSRTVWPARWLDCRTKGQFNALSYHFRGRRSAEHSHIEEKPAASIPQKSASKTSLESLGNITMTSRKSTKPSINDFQDFVSMMQKTITGLRKQIKRLEKRLSKTECTDNNGQERKDGERWKKDSCTLCECKDAQVTCFIESCPPAGCKQPVKLKGVCCAVCIQHKDVDEWPKTVKSHE